MFGNVKLDKGLLKKVRMYAKIAGYSSPEEFITHALEKEIANMNNLMLVFGGTQEEHDKLINRRELFQNLLSAGFGGVVYPVNPGADVVQAVAAYKSVKDIPGEVDLAVIMVPAKHVLGVLDCCFGGLAVKRSAPPVAAGLSSRARQVITAGNAAQEVLDGGGGGRSVFTGALLDGVKGRADVDAEALAACSRV